LGSWIHVPSFIIELAYLADLLQSRSFGFAGTKDKRAVTTQQVRIPQVYDKTIVICSSLIWPWSFFLRKINHGVPYWLRYGRKHFVGFSYATG
jgi:hypothetical protein